jgi:predicted Ser/Thr protein kinase
MKRKSHIKGFLEHTEKLNISGVSESKLNNPHQMLVGSQYKITEPVYDDYDEGLQPETDIVEVVNKSRYGFILRNIEHNFTYERTFQHLMTCEIEEV